VVEGQLQGAVALGIGRTLLEEIAYDEGGQLLAGSYMDYLLPTATDVPTMVIDHLGPAAAGLGREPLAPLRTPHALGHRARGDSLVRAAVHQDGWLDVQLAGAHTSAHLRAVEARR
jgi:hypothetical protein